jgi:nicotinate-nucleotide adenylyltransferase
MRRSAPFRFGSISSRPPHAKPGQRIGLLGGSFNPPHAAHRLITDIAMKRLALDRIWWLVTPGNPLKQRHELMPLAERVALAKAMIENPNVVVTDFEKELRTTFTAATLAHLVMRYREVHFVWLMGADCLAGFHRWQHWRQIFEMMPIAVVDRPGWRLKAIASRSARTFTSKRIPEGLAYALPTAKPPCWTYLTGPTMRLSSSQIRQGEAVGQARGRKA